VTQCSWKIQYLFTCSILCARTYLLRAVCIPVQRFAPYTTFSLNSIALTKSRVNRLIYLARMHSVDYCNHRYLCVYLPKLFPRLAQAWFMAYVLPARTDI